MSENNNIQITREEMELLINGALDYLYKADAYLIDNNPFILEKNGNHHVGERSIVFRLAHYMQNMMDSNPLYDDYVLDCEYNRNGIHAKALPSFEAGVYPDIIIHNRGNNDLNLLIMEVKTYWNPDNIRDKMKIKEFTDENGDYHFSYGVSLTIKKRRKDVKVEFQ